MESTLLYDVGYTISTFLWERATLHINSYTEDVIQWAVLIDKFNILSRTTVRILGLPASPGYINEVTQIFFCLLLYVH